MRTSPSTFDVEIETFGRAVGNETRFRMLQLLSHGPKPVKVLTKALGGMSQPCISQHLKTLKHSQLVSSRRFGQEMHYSFNAKKYHEMLGMLASQVVSSKVRHRQLP